MIGAGPLREVKKSDARPAAPSAALVGMKQVDQRFGSRRFRASLLRLPESLRKCWRAKVVRKPRPALPSIELGLARPVRGPLGRIAFGRASENNDQP
jgi:hypothetical protein